MFLALLNPSLAATLDNFDESPTFGTAIAGVGDVDGDGLDDLVVSQIGLVHLFLGTPEGAVRVGSWGGDAADYFGFVVSAAGDVNGDGFDDFAVGAPYASDRDGRVTVYMGGPGGGEQVLLAERAGAQLGRVLTRGGDIDGDGFDDLLAGYPMSQEVAVYFGSAAGLGGPVFLEGSGWKVAGGYDLDGDGFADVVLGGGGTAAVLAHHGDADRGLDRVSSVAGSSEVDGDVDVLGSADGQSAEGVVIGSFRYGAEWAPDGKVTVVPPDMSTGTSTSIWETDFGSEVVALGDVDGDGTSDFAAIQPDHGRVRLYLDGVRGEPVEIEHLSAIAVAAAGDLDGDGRADVAVAMVGGDVELFCGFGGLTDGDGDGFAVSGELGGCGDAFLPLGDCDDSDPRRSPAADEIPDDGIDQDCDGYAEPVPDDPVGAFRNARDVPEQEPAEELPEYTHTVYDLPPVEQGCSAVGRTSGGILGVLALLLSCRRRRR